MAPRKIVTPDVLGILPLQDAVLFPNTVIPLAVIKRPGIALVEEALREGKQIGLVVLKDKDTEDPGPDDLRRIGTIGTIQKMLKVPDGTLRCIVAGGPVFEIDQIVATEPYLAATYHELPEITEDTDNLVAMQRNLGSLFQKLLGYLPQAPREMEMEVNNISDPNLLTYFVASTMRLDTADRQAILEERNTEQASAQDHDAHHQGARSGRARTQDPVRHPARDGEEPARVLSAPAAARDSGRAGRDRSAASRDERAAQEDRRSRACPRTSKKAADRELDRLAKVPTASPEYSVIRTYLDWLVQLPWNKSTSDQIDIDKARADPR